jgi:hypothetical protein
MAESNEQKAAREAREAAEAEAQKQAAAQQAPGETALLARQWRSITAADGTITRVLE